MWKINFCDAKITFGCPQGSWLRPETLALVMCCVKEGQTYLVVHVACIQSWLFCLIYAGGLCPESMRLCNSESEGISLICSNIGVVVCSMLSTVAYINVWHQDCCWHVLPCVTQLSAKVSQLASCTLAAQKKAVMKHMPWIGTRYHSYQIINAEDSNHWYDARSVKSFAVCPCCKSGAWGFCMSDDYLILQSCLPKYRLGSTKWLFLSLSLEHECYLGSVDLAL